MPRLEAIDPAKAGGKTKELFDAVRAKLGVVPNMMRTMAESPSVLEGYLSLSGSLAGGTLDARTRERIAIAVAEVNECGYCAAAHRVLGKMAGLGPEDLADAKSGRSHDPKTQAILRLAGNIAGRKGNVGDEEIAAARAAGISNGEIAEVVANVALNVLTNYFNHVAQTEIDF
jgi:uncharacterized peroxidase-related enzyme